MKPKLTTGFNQVRADDGVKESPIIVGSAEAMYLVFSGRLDFLDGVARFALPTLAGNIVGGSLIFALLSHAQVRSDVD